ncbi:hypothetical protein OG242_11855 [Streptomyces sp. NBC_00727]|uniref:hypothetical protein n=1 Tax=Streptomyces sp. NBC_00727 TaxID=2903675 RepID=UPI003870C38B
MASVHPRKNKAGEITSYQVKWRLGGGREAPVQTERFDDESAASDKCSILWWVWLRWPGTIS